jgi:hypothetical protein
MSDAVILTGSDAATGEPTTPSATITSKAIVNWRRTRLERRQRLVLRIRRSLAIVNIQGQNDATGRQRRHKSQYQARAVLRREISWTIDETPQP